MEKTKIQELMEKATIAWEGQIDGLTKELKKEKKELSQWKKRCHELTNKLSMVKKDNEELKEKIRKLEAQLETKYVKRWEHPSMRSKLDIKVTKW